MLPTIGLFAIVVFSLCLYNFRHESTPTFKDNIVIGDIDLSGKDYETGKNLLDEVFNKPVYINLEDQSRSVTLEEIGITYDEEALKDFTETCRFVFPKSFCVQNDTGYTKYIEFPEEILKKVFPKKTKIYEDIVSPSNSVIKINKEKLDSYLNSLEEEFQFLSNNTIISFEDFSFRVPSNNAKVKIDRDVFTTGNIAEQINTGKIKIRLNLDTIDDIEKQKEHTDKLISNMTNPLLIKYGGTPIWIPSETLEDFIKTKEESGNYYGYISEEEISNYLNELHKDYKTEDVIVLHNDAVRAIRLALLYRSTDYQINNAVILPLEGRPRTDGSLHDVYLEVIKSQQRLYRFENGELVKTYVVSTGLTWDTPEGNFEVFGKQKMTISYFGNWYMPDYLPVGTINGVYRFGFHAIPYHMDGAGNIYSRDPNTMGSPATGGCIQLRPEEATELFEWAEIGTPVYIYE